MCINKVHLNKCITITGAWGREGSNTDVIQESVIGGHNYI